MTSRAASSVQRARRAIRVNVAARHPISERRSRDHRPKSQRALRIKVTLLRSTSGDGADGEQAMANVAKQSHDAGTPQQRYVAVGLARASAGW